MKQAERVTFGGGGGLDRRAELRDSPEGLQNLWNERETRVLLFWRGKLLSRRSDPERGLNQLAFVSPRHPLVAQHLSQAFFLGIGPQQEAYFAHDISSWQPDALDEMALASFVDQSEQQHPDLPAGEVFAELRLIMARLSPLQAELAASAKALFSWHHSHGFCAKCGAPSQLSQAGWQRLCPRCAALHFPRTDPVVIMLVTHGDDVLMGRSPGWPDGMYSLLAGFVEPGETLEAAVRREVQEETGVAVAQVDYLSSQPWPFPMSLMIGCHGHATSREITIDPKEIEDAIWVSRQDIMMSFAGEHPVLKPARKGAIAHFLLENWLADTLD